MKTLKNTFSLILLALAISSCVQDPINPDPLDPCIDKKIIGLAIGQSPNQEVFDANIVFGEFNGNQYYNEILPSQTTNISVLNPNDANTYNPTTDTYSYLFTEAQKIVHINRGTGITTESSLPTLTAQSNDKYRGLIYAPYTQKYYTVRVNVNASNVWVYLHEINDITSSPVTFAAISMVLYMGLDAEQAATSQSHFKMVVDNGDKLYILTNKDIFTIHINNQMAALPVTLGDFNNGFAHIGNRYSSLTYDQDNNELLFLESNADNSTLKLKKTTLPLPSSGNLSSSLVQGLSSVYSSFNLDFHSAVLACDDSFLISNHVNSQSSVDTEFIKVEGNGTINTFTLPKHIFGLQNID